MPHTLFISDTHLCISRQHTNTLFFDFLRNTATKAESLYVLGDLFEYWPGDDDIDEPLHTEVASAFSQLKDRGVALFLMHGNRDFLVGEKFCKAAGMTLLKDPYLFDLHGTSTLLMHGDTLCTDDIAYIAFRDQVRNPAWQAAFLAKPLAERKMIIEGLRESSKQAQTQKSTEIMDVTNEAVQNTLRIYNYPRLIHGHTHRPAKHAETVDGKICERWVLPDWYEHGGYLRCDSSGCEMIHI
ncbi:UDP-2,3-diacylglucosamine diphosphatase [Sulfurirhabdus autotrophica]|uniref:UDP-2,3-diacylglucosamine hydrolase n=1 Tax=Sulfurirhabdus autotrophica TaxID=1706046 RepID=A0A4R3YIN3_9PROT|nr:UDP-2,3-diacylglucosamine diphosphatase [Sulfurirhabdus autotrophica]TCV90864.1 UDP-2,3-diacylglucosamine hydrolase [Sulfurirhabdus autotrophica]